MKKRKFMLCQYPEQGFGGKSGQWYLLDVFGNKYDITDEYDNVLKEMNKVVKIDKYEFTGVTTDELIKAIEVEFDTKIERW